MKPLQFSLRSMLEAVAWVAILVSLSIKSGLFVSLIFLVPLIWARILAGDIIRHNAIGRRLLVMTGAIGVLLSWIVFFPACTLFGDYSTKDDLLNLFRGLSMLGVWSGALLGVLLRVLGFRDGTSGGGPSTFRCD
jgi:hypothetical protein